MEEECFNELLGERRGPQQVLLLLLVSASRQ
jgi:hypothetical protein